MSLIPRTTNELVSEDAFKAVLWVTVGLCIVTGSLRFGIRLTCFRYLFVEDYLMLAGLAILVSLAAVLQHYLADIYLITHVQNQLVVPGPDFPIRLASGLRGDGIALVLNTIGIWTIKLSFLLFFKRLGHQIRPYMTFWWIAFALVVCCGVIHIGLIPFDCIFASTTHLTGQCALRSSVSHIYNKYIGSVIIDVCTDTIIICFPVFIIWRTKISLRQKLVLTGIFLLVGFTIGVTIIRGSIFGGVYRAVEDVDSVVIDTSWVLFWLLMEYIVSFIIACIISFRSLWVNSMEKARDQKIELQKRRRIVKGLQSPTPTGRGLHARWREFHDSVLDTLGDLEGTTLDRNDLLLQFQPPSGRMTVDFSQWDDTTHGGSRDHSTI
ncbi:Uu.00g071660.m01.CDS01 [Anthostomella pinea]|uniref:Uu.00g071660.m01.CDS01 n=1 Tax=Anthostomella pinea TaxID=933095 RepID=A0AAI8YNW7_9PEZI|nr:Uu.00g071660.m01.CDS01 [Anthostomella pinea]